MEVASLELCQELYSLSGWDSYSGFKWGQKDESSKPELVPHGHKTWTYWPAYSLGYLLRKLPRLCEVVKTRPGEYFANYKGDYNIDAETPEDALCELTVELFKDGSLKRDVGL